MNGSTLSAIRTATLTLNGRTIAFQRMVVLVMACMLPSAASLNRLQAGDWMTWRSTYTHDPQSGMRVDQYAKPVEPPSPTPGNYVRSGYRHYRSTIQGSTTADNLHVTEEWGRPVVPYEQWRFPYRPYGAPYSAWGPPTPGVLSNTTIAPWGFPSAVPGMGVPGMGVPGMGVPGMGVPGMGVPGMGVPGVGVPGFGLPGLPGGGFFPLVPPYQPAPWYDGLYPSAPPLGR